MVVAPYLTVKPHPDCSMVTEPSVYTVRSCDLLFSGMRSLISASVLPAGHLDSAFPRFLAGVYYRDAEITVALSFRLFHWLFFMRQIKEGHEPNSETGNSLDLEYFWMSSVTAGHKIENFFTTSLVNILMNSPLMHNNSGSFDTDSRDVAKRSLSNGWLI